jgi:hypothetical protein
VSRSRAEQRYGIEVKRRAAAVYMPDTPYILTAFQNTTYDENQIQCYQGEITRKVDDVGKVHLNSRTCLLYLLPNRASDDRSAVGHASRKLRMSLIVRGEWERRCLRSFYEHRISDSVSIDHVRPSIRLGQRGAWQCLEVGPTIW